MIRVASNTSAPTVARVASKKVEPISTILNSLGWVSFWLGLLLVVLGFFVIPGVWILLGSILVACGIVGAGQRFIPEPWIGIRLRFGKKKDKLSPGRHFLWPYIDTIDKWSRPFERVIDIIPLPDGELPKVLLHDEYIFLRDYTITLKIGNTFKDIDNAVYGEQDWVDWIRTKSNALILGYIRTLGVPEATDGGMLRGNLIDRIREAEGVAKKKLSRLRSQLKSLKKAMEKAMGSEDEKIDASNPAIVEFEDEIARVKPLPALYKEMWEAMDKLIQSEAPERGIVNITGIFIGAVKLSEELEKARRNVQIQKRKAEAALFEALQESAMRIAPVLDMKGKLQTAGMPKESDALKTALAFEFLETIAEHGGAWALALSQGGSDTMGAIPALLMKHLESLISDKPAKESITTQEVSEEEEDEREG